MEVIIIPKKAYLGYSKTYGVGWYSDAQRKAIFAELGRRGKLIGRKPSKSKAPSRSKSTERTSRSTPSGRKTVRKQTGKVARKTVRATTGRSVSESQVYKIQSKRNKRARAVDNKKTSKVVYSIKNPEGRKKWAKNPGKVDLTAIDTKVTQAGAAKREKVLLRISKRKGSVRKTKKKQR